MTKSKDFEVLQDLADCKLIKQTRNELTIDFDDLTDLREAKKSSDKDFLSHDDILKALSL